MSAGPDVETPDADLRRRAAWLLAMLAVVAGLIVVLFVTLGGTSGGKTQPGAISEPSSSVPAAPTPAASSTAPARSSSAATGGTSSTGNSSGTSSSGSSGPVPAPSCPSNAICSVTGDVAGAQQAVDAFRSSHSKQPVPVTSDAAAQRCARTSGSDCPSAFVWVRVSDLSGASLVRAVSGFNASDDLLDDTAASFGVGWAYDPASKTASCAVVRND